MRVKLMTSVATAYGVFQAGQVINHPMAAELVRSGLAVPVVENARRKPVEAATRPKRRRMKDGLCDS